MKTSIRYSLLSEEATSQAIASPYIYIMTMNGT